MRYPAHAGWPAGRERGCWLDPGAVRRRLTLACGQDYRQPEQNRRVPQLASLVVIVGPIASGKSSVAARVAERLLEAGGTSAVVDLDDVADCLVAPKRDWEARWRRARQVHDELVAAFRRSGVDHVIAHGSFFYLDEPSAVPTGVHDSGALRVLLSVSYEKALERAQRDPNRGVSKDPSFLRWTHDQFAQRTGTLAPGHLKVDADTESIEDIAEMVMRACI